LVVLLQILCIDGNNHSAPLTEWFS